jgi:hypothetical protein
MSRRGDRRRPIGQVPWGVFWAFTAVEVAALWLIWLLFEAKTAWLVQVIPLLCVGLPGWFALQRLFAMKRPLVEIPELSVSRMTEIKRAWSFVAFLYLPLLLFTTGVMVLALLAFDLGGGFFWPYAAGLPSQALWNSNACRLRYIRYVWGEATVPST